MPQLYARKFGGKIYKGESFFCPGEYSWAELGKMIKEVRKEGLFSVRTVKISLSSQERHKRPKNTHVVWVYYRKK